MGKYRREVLIAVTKAMFKVIALVFRVLNVSFSIFQRAGAPHISSIIFSGVMGISVTQTMPHALLIRQLMDLCRLGFANPLKQKTVITLFSTQNKMQLQFEALTGKQVTTRKARRPKNNVG